MPVTLAQVLQHFGPRYHQAHQLLPAQARVWRDIVSCRTRALGGQRLRCTDCGVEHWRWHSCRNRHCPQCQSRERDAWRAARMTELLDVPYCHLVFTLPHELNALCAMHARWVYDTVMRCTAATLNEFAANERWLGGMGSFTLVLHTWTQELQRHVHVHALMACGALQLHAAQAELADGSNGGNGGPDVASWVRPARSPRFLFPQGGLSKVFKGKFLDELRQAISEGALPRDPAATPLARAKRLRDLQRHDWVVYAKTPLAGPAAVLDYLSRYTHRSAIGNERLVAIEGDKVLLRVRADNGQGKRQGKRQGKPGGKSGGKRTVAVDGVEFIHRFLQHVLPSGFKRIRHYGLLAPVAKTQRLALARQLLAMPPANPLAREQAQDFMRRVANIEINKCPHCKTGRWLVVEQLLADRAARQAIVPTACRGPP